MKAHRFLPALTLSLVLAGLPALPILGEHTPGSNQTGKAAGSPQNAGQRELQVEDYQINVTVMPGHPQPHETTRVIVYAKNLASGAPYLGEMRFGFAERTIFWTAEPFLETGQMPRGERHIETVEFPGPGSYMLRFGLVDKGRTLEAEFMLRVGQRSVWWKYTAVFLLAAGTGGIAWKALAYRRKEQPGGGAG